MTAEGPVGMTVSAFTSLSLDPPLVVVALSGSAHSAAPIIDADGFAVHMLADDQRELSVRFASHVERFAGLTYETGMYGAPLFDGCIARLQCERHDVYEGGDHSILIGRVVRADVWRGNPLIYYRGDYRTIDMDPPS